MISPTETLILSLLAKCPSGAFASELMEQSEGKLKRGSVYTTLSRMEQSGLITSKGENHIAEEALPRTKYRITAAGVNARVEFGEWTGLVIGGGAT